MARSKGLRLEVHGDKELARSFTRAANDIGEATDRVERDEGERAARDARNRAPRRRGKLRGSVRSHDGTVTAGGLGVPYAGPIHFGWPSRPNPARGWRGGPIAPNPFLYDVVDERERDIHVPFSEAVDDVTANIRT